MLRSVLAVAAQRECLLRAALASVSTSSSQTVLSSAAPPQPPQPPRPPPQPPHPPPPPRRAWPTGAAAAALAVTASLGGVYVWMRSQSEEDSSAPERGELAEQAAAAVEDDGVQPVRAEMFPPHVEFLVAGAGTAAFAALRTLRARSPEARVLLVGREPLPPYQRPPLSKRLWPLGQRALLYEPEQFYAPVERLGALAGGAAVATGWTVVRIDVANRRAELRAPGRPPVSVAYDACLVATGSEPCRLPALREVARLGLALPLRTLADAQRLASALQPPGERTVAVLGGGLLACELAAALARQARVVLVMRGEGPLRRLLPPYLQREAARRLQELGVRLLTHEQVLGAEVCDGALKLALSSGATLHAALAVEAVGARAEPALAAASGLELDAALGGVRVSPELQARPGVWAAGDAACWHDPAAGARRRSPHHDHAVQSGRRAALNMAAAGEGQQPQPYSPHPMFWSELGPQLGYEAVGEVDAQLDTVGVFAAAPEGEKQHARGVVLYLRHGRVVGVLLWNLLNRTQMARQVLARAQFDDLLEVGRLFAPHEDH